MTDDEIIDGIFLREGEGAPPWHAPGDLGGRTRFGISERAHPDVWANGPPSDEVCRAVYRNRYLPPFTPLRALANDRLLDAAIDDGVLRGPLDAIKRLQRVLGVAQDGVIGPQTLHAARLVRPGELTQAYVVERVLRLARVVERNPSQAVNVVGWVRRALGFLPPAL